MTVAGLAYTFNYFTNIFIVNSSETVKYILVFIGATINGLFASILWVSVGRYIHNACHH